MNKLLSAEFSRLFKSMIFRACLLFSGGYGMFMVLMRWWTVKNNAAAYADLDIEYRNADGLIFTGALVLIFVIAVLISAFVGTEYSEGTIRNKLIVGHTRTSIYFSKLIVCAVGTTTIHILDILVVLILGNLLIEGTTMTVAEILAFTTVSTMAMLALTALLLLFSVSIQSKSRATVVCLLTTIIMLFLALAIQSGLEEPEYYDNVACVDGETGEVISVDKEKNPSYLTGTKREVYEWLNTFLPVSQLYQVVINNSDYLGWIIIYDCIIIFVTTGAGIFGFKKIDLK